MFAVVGGKSNTGVQVDVERTLEALDDGDRSSTCCFTVRQIVAGPRETWRRCSFR